MAASPLAFGAVRFFHALDSGSRANTIDDDPLDGGIVWPDGDQPMNFAKTFAALELVITHRFQAFTHYSYLEKS